MPDGRMKEKTINKFRAAEHVFYKLIGEHKQLELFNCLNMNYFQLHAITRKFIQIHTLRETCLLNPLTFFLLGESRVDCRLFCQFFPFFCKNGEII
jgi:hypothetical protein